MSKAKLATGLIVGGATLARTYPVIGWAFVGGGITLAIVSLAN